MGDDVVAPHVAVGGHQLELHEQALDAHHHDGEPQSGELTTVFGAMRNVRTLGSIFGLTYVVNFVFVKNAKDKE